MSRIDEFHYLWENPDGGRYILSEIDSRVYTIIDVIDNLVVEIEDDALLETVIEEMLKAGVPVRDYP